MKKFSKRALFLWVCIAMLLPQLVGFANETEGQLKISQTDLSHWNFDESGLFTFKNEWEYYPNRYIDSRDFDKAQNLGVKRFIQIPQALYNQEDFQNKYDSSYGTLRTQVLIPQSMVGKALSIRSTLFYRDVQIYVNGEALLGSQDVSTLWQRIRTMKPQMVASFTPNSQRVEVVIHFSLKHTFGNTYGNLMLGERDQVTRQVLQRLMIDTFLLSALFILAVFNLIFFLRRNRRHKGERLSLYFSLLVMTMALRMLNSGEHYLLYFIPNMPGELMSKLGYWSYYLLLPLFILFACEVRREMLPPILKRVSAYAAGFFGLFVLMVDHRIYTQITWIYHLYFILVMVQLVAHALRAVQLRSEWLKSELTAFGLIVVIFTLDSFYISGYYDLRNYYMLAILMFLVFVTVMVARVYANAVDQLENLSYSFDQLSQESSHKEDAYALALENQEKRFESILSQKEIRLGALEGIAKELTGAMIILDQALCIVTAYGNTTEKLFGTDYIGQPFLKYFFGENSQTGLLYQDIMHKVIRLEQASRIATYLSLLPKRYYKQGRWFNVETKYVRVNHGDQPVFVLVITDVNKWIQSQKQLEKANMENSILSNYIKHSAALKYLLMRLKQFSGSEMALLIERSKSSDELIEKLIASLERLGIWYEAFGFERSYMRFRSLILELDKLQKEVIPISKEELVEILKDYQIASFDEEDRRLLSEKTGVDLNLDAAALSEIMTRPADVREVFQVLNLYGRVLAKRYGKELAPIIIDVPAIEVSLDKSGHLLRSLTRIFESVILHNIEYYDERQKAGKPLEAQITVSMKKQLESVEIIIEDDGSGVNVNTLKDSLYKLNLLSFKEIVNASEQEILPFIFERDVYYKESDNAFTGIGDSLWRVKETLKRYGGDITVESHYMHYCRFIITVPLEVMQP